MAKKGPDGKFVKDTPDVEPVANGVANGVAAAEVIGELPTRRAFPFSRPPTSVGGRLPPRLPVRAAPIASPGVLGGTTAAPAETPVIPAAGAPGAVLPPQIAPVAPAPPPAPLPPVAGRPVLPSIGGAADQNDYRQRQAEREANRWGKRSEVLQPEATSLVQAWTYYLSIYPPAALTLWLERSFPAENGYAIYITGETFIGEQYPDRALYDRVRRERRQPNIAETFSGRIQGRSAEGQPLDLGGGMIRLPPEPASQAPQWGQPQGPWGGQPMPGYGAPPGYPPPWGAHAPGMLGWPGAPPPGPYGSPWSMPPWWAMYAGAPAPAAPPAAPPAAIAHDPAMVQMWQAMKEVQLAAQHSSGEQQKAASQMQLMLLEKLFDRLAQPAGAPAAAGGGMRESIGLLKDVAGLVNELRGGSGGGGEGAASDALQIVEMKSGEKIFAQKGRVHEGLTYGFAIKDAATDLFKGFRNMRAAVPGRAAGVAAAPVTIDAPGGAPAGPGVSGGGLPPRAPIPRKDGKP